MFKDSEIGYIAGVFDMIGNIRIEIPQKDITKAYLIVWITSKDFDVVEFLQRFYAFIDRRKDGQFKAKWKDKTALKFLKLIKPYSHFKRTQIEVGIEFLESKFRNDDPSTYVIPLQCRLKLLRKSN